jgi:hypothetical protein
MIVLNLVVKNTIGPSYNLVVVNSSEHCIRLLILISSGDIERNHSFINNFSILKLEHKVILLSWWIMIRWESKDSISRLVKTSRLVSCQEREIRSTRLSFIEAYLVLKSKSLDLCCSICYFCGSLQHHYAGLWMTLVISLRLTSAHCFVSRNYLIKLLTVFLEAKLSSGVIAAKVRSDNQVLWSCVKDELDRLLVWGTNVKLTHERGIFSHYLQIYLNRMLT